MAAQEPRPIQPKFWGDCVFFALNNFGQPCAACSTAVLFSYWLLGLPRMLFPRSHRPSCFATVDLLVWLTRPDVVLFEMDAFWVTRAGLDPVELLSKYPDR